MLSKITDGETEKLFSIKVLNKYKVNYFRCKQTGFIQTEDPYWLTEAYSSVITKLDIGLVSRNEELRDKLVKIITNNFDISGRFLDYAGGYGLFTRMMRDKGFDFYHTDPYCQNIFAEYFDLQDLPANTKFELITAFEVFEHLPNPLEDLEKMSLLAENILFSTVLQPSSDINTLINWWYLIPETGQHISLYTVEALQALASKFGYNFYSDNQFVHLFTKKTLAKNPFINEENEYPFFIKIMKRKVDRYLKKLNSKKESLLHKDWEHVKKIIREVQKDL